MNKKSLKSSNNKQNMFDYMVKLIIIGDSGVGKTNILTRFCDNIFKDTHIATIGVDFSNRTLQIDDKRIKMQVWDTAGQQRFRTITQTYYKGATGIILVYGLDSRSSFESIKKWISQVNQRTGSNVKKILIGNKNDVQPCKREISREEGLKMAKDNGLTYFEVSAKLNSNIEDAFYQMGKMIKSQLDSENNGLFEGLSKTITVSCYNKHRLDPTKNQNWDQQNSRGNWRKCNC